MSKLPPGSRCERCNELLNEKRAIWLELDTRTSTYTNQGVPQEHSQGFFIFGKDCAKRELAKTKGDL